MKHILIVNLKAYGQGFGRNALKLAKIAERVSEKTGDKIILAVQPSDIRMLSRAVKIPIYAQHIDPIDCGSHTGHILPEGVKQAGAKGTLINHAERRIDIESIRKCIEKCKSIGLTSVVCVPNIKQAKKIAQLWPDFIAFEDTKLIGTLKSISQLEPESVRKFAGEVRKINPNVVPLCGAGVANGNDVRAAIRLGTNGVLVATAAVKAKNQEKAILDLVKGFG